MISIIFIFNINSPIFSKSKIQFQKQENYFKVGVSKYSNMSDHHQNLEPSQPPEKRVFYDLLTRVGSKGTYQKYALFIVYCINIIGSATFFVNPFLFYQKPYTCNGVQSVHCTNFVCSLPLSQRSAFYSPQAVVSLGNQNSLYFCEDIRNVTLMQESIFSGAFFGVVLVGLFSDVIGRKKTIFDSMILALIGILLIAFIPNIIVKCIGFIFWGIGSDISFAVSASSYITQIVAEEDRPNAYVGINIAFSVGVTINAAIFFIFKNWFYILLGFYALGYLLASIAFFVYVEKPPIQIISHNLDPNQSYKAFMRIAQKNQVTNHGIKLEEIEEIHREYHKKQKSKFFTFADICRYKSLRGDFIKVSFGFFIVMLLEYAPALLMQKLVPNIFVSGLANGISQFLSIPFLPYFNQNVSRRPALMVMFGLSTIFTIFQYFLDPSGCINCLKGLSLVLLMICFFISRFFINMAVNFYFNSLNESFPAQIRSICYCGVISIGRCSSLLIPFIPSFSQVTSIPINLIFAFLGVIGIIACWLLRQTIKIPPPQIIEELKQNSSDHKQQGKTWKLEYEDN